MRRHIAAIVAAGVLGLLGVVGVVLYAHGADQRAVAGAQPRSVYVSQKQIPAGTSLADAVANRLLTQAELPAKAVPTGALIEVTEANKGLLAVTDIAPGEYVLAARFGTTPQGSMAIQVPPGQVAISVALSDPARVGQFVTPGSHLVVYDTVEAPGSQLPAPAGGTQPQSVKETRVLLDDVLVIAIGATGLTPTKTDTTDAAAPSSAEARTLVTVALAPDQATRLVHGIQTGSLYAGLRGADAKVNAGFAVSDVSIFTK